MIPSMLVNHPNLYDPPLDESEHAFNKVDPIKVFERSGKRKKKKEQ